MKVVQGAELREGDVVQVWWKPGRDTVVKIEEYEGPLAHFYPHGAITVTFAVWHLGMTSGKDEKFNLFNRVG